MALTIRRLTGLAVVTMLLLSGCRGQAPRGAATPAPKSAEQPVSVTIYVPCGMTVPFHEVFRLFEAANPGLKVAAVYDNDAVLLQRVEEKGERPDLFVSPGGREFAVLVQRGLAEAGHEVAMGSFKIVAVVRRGWSGKLTGPQDLASSQVKTVALPDPERTSMGWHVRQSLQKLGLWEKVQPKIKPAGRIIEAYEALLRGQVDLTFTYRGCPLPKDPQQLEKSKARIAFELPLDSYDEPKVTIGLVTGLQHPQEATRLLSFLRSSATQTLMVREGLPDERGESGVTASEAVATRPSAPTPGRKVVIQGFFPDDDRHREVRQFLMGLKQQFPGRVEVALHDFHDPEGDPEGFAEWQKAGFGCAGLLINGKNVFTLGEREVTFQRKMGVAWTKEECLQAVRGELGERAR